MEGKLRRGMIRMAVYFFIIIILFYFFIFIIFFIQDIYYYNHKELLKKKIITKFKTTAITDILTIIYISQLYTLQPQNSRAIAE